MMETGSLFTAFFLICGLGVILGAILPDRKNPPVLAVVASLAALTLLWASGRVLFFDHSLTSSLWRVSPLIRLSIEIDGLSSFFLFVTGLVFLPVSIFSAGYLKRYLGAYSLKSFALFYHLLFASIVLTLIAGDVFSFFIAWEAMSILSYLLVNFEHRRQENTRSGFLMLAMSEAGTLAGLVAFLVMANATGGIDFASLRSLSLGQSSRWAVFILSFFGFGVKAGLVPVNSWLPRAHPAAPGNVSALLSGVIVNLGIYGIVRVNVDLLPMTSAGPGLVVLLVGALSALIGVLYANIEHNLKTMLAHHTVEQMGIVTIGLGAGMVFAATGHPVIATLAFVAAVYHMTNHSLYKALLFMSAAWVDTAVGVRDMDRLGGLIKRMPWTALFFLIGAISLVALPPFNGFVSEWLTLQTLLQASILASKGAKMAFALCGAGLALTAGLAVTCFVKAFAMSFLGMVRSEEARNSSDPPRSMTIPMGILAISCFLLGILPTYVIPQIDRVVAPYAHESAVDALVPPFFTVGEGNERFPKAFVSEFHSLGAQVGSNVLPGRGLVIMHRGSTRNPVIFAMSPSYTIIVLVLLLASVILVVRVLTRKRALARRPAWDGGVRTLTPTMTYTATGFSNPVRVIFNSVLRPVTIQDSKETIAQHFLDAIKKDRREVHLVDRLLSRPVVFYGRGLALWLARMHSGRVNAYAAYILVTLLIVLLIMGVA
jgi:hydrogenase-4 component B